MNAENVFFLFKTFVLLSPSPSPVRFKCFESYVWNVELILEHAFFVYIYSKQELNAQLLCLLHELNNRSEQLRKARTNFPVLGFCVNHSIRETFYVFTPLVPGRGLQFNTSNEENSMHNGHRLHTHTHTRTHVFVRACVPHVATAVFQTCSR